MESPSVKGSYSVGDRVFAKLTGFPHWPAQVTEKREGPSDEYCVAFFGSNDIAYVKSGSMCSYTEENVKKFSPAGLKSKKTKIAAQYKRALEECAANVTFLSVALEDNWQGNLGDIPSGSLQGQANGKPDVPEIDLEETPGSSGGGNNRSFSRSGRKIKPKTSMEDYLQDSLTPSRASPTKLKTAPMELAVEPSGVKKRKASSDEPADEEEPAKKIALEKDDGSSGGSSDEPQILQFKPARVNRFLTPSSTPTQVPAQFRWKEEAMLPMQDKLISSCKRLEILQSQEGCMSQLLLRSPVKGKFLTPSIPTLALSSTAPSTSQQHPLPKSLDAIARVVAGESAKNSRIAKMRVSKGPSTPVSPVVASAAVNKQVSQVLQESVIESPPPLAKELNGTEDVTKSEMQPGPSRESIKKEQETVKRTPRSVSSKSKSDTANSGNKKAQVETPKRVTFGTTETKTIDPDGDDMKIVTGSTVAVGDRVFAKVVGFPYWPAQVTDKISEDDFQVAFYGTHQTGFVKSNALCPYNEDSIGKHSPAMSKKKRATVMKFRNAIAECDSNVSFLGDDLDSSKGGEGVLGSAISDVPAVVSKANQMGGYSNGEEVYESETVDDDSDVEIPIIVTSVKSLSEKVEPSTPKTEVKPEMEKGAPEDGGVYSRSGRKIKPKTPMNEYLENAFNSSRFSPVKTPKEEVVKSEVSSRGVSKRKISLDGEKEVPTQSKKVAIDKDLSSNISIPTTRKSRSRPASDKVAANTDAVISSDEPEIVHIKPSSSRIRRFLASNDSSSPASQQFGWKEDAVKPLQDKFIGSCKHIEFLQYGGESRKTKGQVLISSPITDKLVAASFPLSCVSPSAPQQQPSIPKSMGAIAKVVAGWSSKRSKSANRKISVGTSTKELALPAQKSQVSESLSPELVPKVPEVVPVEDKVEVVEPQLESSMGATDDKVEVKEVGEEEPPLISKAVEDVPKEKEQNVESEQETPAPVVEAVVKEKQQEAPPPQQQKGKAEEVPKDTKREASSVEQKADENVAEISEVKAPEQLKVTAHTTNVAEVKVQEALTKQKVEAVLEEKKQQLKSQNQHEEVEAVTEVVIPGEKKQGPESHNQQEEIETVSEVIVPEEKNQEFESHNQKKEVEKVIEVVPDKTHEVPSEPKQVEEPAVKASEETRQEDELPEQKVDESVKASEKELPEELEVHVADTQIIEDSLETEAPEDISMHAESELPKEVVKERANAEVVNGVSEVPNGIPTTEAAEKEKVDDVVGNNTTPTASVAANVKTPTSATKRARTESPKKAEVTVTRTHLQRRVELPKRYHDSLVTFTKDSTPKPTVSVNKKIESISGKAMKSSTSTTDRKKSPVAPVNGVANGAPSNGVAPEEDAEDSESEPYEITEVDFPDEPSKQKFKDLTKAKDVIETLSKLCDSVLEKDPNLDLALVTLTKLSDLAFVDKSMLKSYPDIVHVVKKLVHYVGNPKVLRLNKNQKAEFDEKASKIREQALKAVEGYKEIMTTNTKPLAVLMMEEMQRQNNET